MDISKIKTGERTVEILHPANDVPIGIRVTLIAMTDEETLTTRRNIMNQRLKLESKNKNFKANELEQNNRDLIFACMRGWEWYDPKPDSKEDTAPVFEGESSPKFNRRNVMKILETLPWFSSQLDEALEEDKAFFTK